MRRGHGTNRSIRQREIADKRERRLTKQIEADRKASKMRIALCKINMIGAPALILGHEYVREDYEKPYWDKYQLFTCEDLVGNATFNQEMIKPRADKYGGKTVHFTSINKELTPFVSAHDFSFTDAEAVEVTRDEWHALVKELNKDQWEAFDWETWGK